MLTTRPTLLGRLHDKSDDAAWLEFDRRYSDLVVRYCRKAGLQPAEAEDTRQQVFLSLAKALPEFRYDPETGRFRDYLGVVVRNAIRRRFERQVRDSRGIQTGTPETEPADDDPLDERWNREWMLHHYRKAMADVRATFQPASLEVFDALLAGRTGESIARDRSITPDAVYKIKQRIRDRLSELIEQQLRDEELPRDERRTSR